MLTLYALGRPRLEGPEGELLRGRRKELALLAYLARRRSSVSRDELAEVFWGERPDAHARQSLRQALLQLKRAVPTGLEAEADTVVLAPGALQLDADLFEADLAALRREDAVARWEGDFLTGYEDAGGPAFRAWLEAERQALRSRLQVALAELVHGAQQAGDAGRVLAWAERWVTYFPMEERAATELVRALHRAGRGGDALARHAAFTARLRQELEMEPSPEFARLASDLVPARPAPRRTPVSGALLTPELVGRQAALDALRHAWDAAAAGTTTLVLVEGEEGIGKTRLCEEFLRTLPPRTVVLRARGSETGRAAAYSVLSELLAALAQAPGLAGAPAPALAAVGALVPSVRERFPGVAAGETPPALADAVAAVLGAVAAETPVLLFVDDFQLVDRDSRNLLLALARQLRQQPVCLVMTSRGDDGPAELQAQLRAVAGKSRIRLTPLSQQDAEALLESMLELAPDARAALARRLHTESGGNPFYLIETTAALLDEGRIAPDDHGVWRPTTDLADERLPVPATLRAAARRRLDTLSPTARRAAEAAAVLMVAATAECIALMTQLPEDQIESALEELQLRRVLRAPSAADGAYTFAHDVSRRAVLEALTGAQRRRLHARALRTLRGPAAPERVPAAVLDYHRRRAGPFGGRLPAWLGPRPLVAGALALAALVAWLRLGPSGSALAERDWVLLADLENTTGDSVFDESLTAALFVALRQSEHVNLYPPARVQETLQRMRRSGGAHLSEQLAREVAQREGIRAVLTLSLSRTDDRYTLTSRIVDPATGSTGATLSAEAVGREQVLEALDALAVDLRGRLGETAREIRERNVPLPRATTASLGALKAFAEGMRAMDEGRSRDAVTALRAAIALDSGFAWAHAALGRYLVWTNFPVDAESYLERALALTDRLPPRERLYVQWTVARGRRDRAATVELARQYLRQYPDDRDAWFALGRSLQEAGDREGALEAYRRELEVDPNASDALENSALLYSLLGRPGEAVAAFERALVADSSLATRIAGDRNRMFGFALLSLGDTARARATFTLLLSGDPAQRANGFRSLALLEAYQGRYRRAADWLTQAIRLNEEDDAWVSELRNRLHLSGMYRTAGLPDAAREQLHRALAIQERTPLMPLTWLGFLGQHLARSGLLTEAEDVFSAMNARGPLPDRRDSAFFALVGGEIALAQGDAATAVTALGSAAEQERGNFMRQGFARALANAGRRAEAAAAYEAMLRDSALGDEGQEPWVLAHYELARLYDAMGDSAAATPLYRRLANLWRNGDPSLPLLQAVRQRLASP